MLVGDMVCYFPKKKKKSVYLIKLGLIFSSEFQLVQQVKSLIVEYKIWNSIFTYTKN